MITQPLGYSDRLTISETNSEESVHDDAASLIQIKQSYQLVNNGDDPLPPPHRRLYKSLNGPHRYRHPRCGYIRQRG